MIEDVVAFKIRENQDWQTWPFPSYMKPSNPQLMCYTSGSFPICSNPRTYVAGIYALRLSDGREWTTESGFTQEQS